MLNQVPLVKCDPPIATRREGDVFEVQWHHNGQLVTEFIVELAKDSNTPKISNGRIDHALRIPGSSDDPHDKKRMIEAIRAVQGSA